MRGMLVRVLVAGLHFLALGMGLGSVVVRGLMLRDLRRDNADARALTRLFRSDAIWGLAAALWIATGLLRVFVGLDKAAVFYLRNGFFHVKMTLFLLVFALEIVPMVTFIRWRKAHRQGALSLTGAPFERLIRLNDVEVALIFLIPFVAALMVRGAWLF